MTRTIATPPANRTPVVVVPMLAGSVVTLFVYFLALVFFKTVTACLSDSD